MRDPKRSGAAATTLGTTVPEMGLELQAGRKVPFNQVLSWALWDWGSAAFNSVVTTFVFTVYLTSTKAFGGESFVSIWLGVALAVAGFVVGLLAPITGQRSDGSGRRKLWLAINTAVVVACIFGLYFVEPKAPLLWLGLGLLALGTVFYELAAVNYNAMLVQVSTPKTVGRVSGFGWSMGYFGGIVLLLILYFGFIHPDVGLFGVTSEDGQSVRISMILAAIWFAIFALPVLFRVKEYSVPNAVTRERIPFLASYLRLGRDIERLWGASRRTLKFLVASAIFRDGLTGVFTFGGVLAAGTFGFSAGEVIIFAIAANVVAGLSTVIVGTLDDRAGPKPVIVAALIGLVVSGLAVFVFHAGGQTVFWIFGLALCLFVGPAQSASRTYLSRIVPAGREGEVFGLYATTGRAATYIAPSMFAVFIQIFGAQYWGILGIVLVILVGLVLMILVREEKTAATPSTSDDSGFSGLGAFLSVVLPPVGLVLGIIALVNNRGHRTLALAAVIIAPIVMILVVGFVITQFVR